MLALRAVHRARSGDADGSFSDALDAAALGARIQSGLGASLFEASFGGAMKITGLNALGRVLAEVEVDAAQSRELTARLEKLRVDPDGWRRMWGLEYQSYARMIASFEGYDARELEPSFIGRVVPARYVFKPNATLAIIADAYRILGAQGGKPCSRVRWPDAPLSGRRMGRAAARSEQRRPQRELDVHLRLRPAWGCTAARRTHASKPPAPGSRCARTRATTARCPRVSRSSCRPTSRKFPTDAFDAEPLRYDRERRLLWSIGSDFADAGGSADPADPAPAPEPVFPIPF